MKFAFTLTPSESRRLIAKGVAAMDKVKRALENAYVIIAGGTTNAYVLEELLNKQVEPQRFTVGISCRGVLCITDPDRREQLPVILHRGEPVQVTIKEALEDFHKDTIVIKGANAVDPEGNVGVITSGFDGGTVAQIIGTVTSQGLGYIVPVGLEKLVPSVKKAVQVTGAKFLDYTMGADFGMYCLVKADVVTEIRALEILFGVKATHVASGGVGGNEGAVTLVVEGEDEKIKAAVKLLNSIKGEPPIKSLKRTCENCQYKQCYYNGLKEEELPPWLRD